MKFYFGDILTHKYDISRLQYMGVGYLITFKKDLFIIKFSKLQKHSGYIKKSMYNLQIYTDIFRERS